VHRPESQQGIAASAASENMDAIALPADSLVVIVSDLGGNQLEVRVGPSQIVGDLRTMVCKFWEGLQPKGVRFLAGTKCLNDEVVMGSLGSDLIVLQLVKYDPLLGLGQFEPEGHRGIEVQAVGDDCSTVIKTSSFPDSNNVFLRHAVQQPCFVEFSIVRSSDEMSVGVTTLDRTRQISGFGNLDLKHTWIYSKRKAMPKLLFGGEPLNPDDVPSYHEGDIVAVFVDPEAGLVKFYKNRKFVASNLPDYPVIAGVSVTAEDQPCRIYTMVDGVHDEIAVISFGPGEPYPIEDSTGA